MKKFFALFLSVLMLVSFTACSDFAEGFEEGMQDALQSAAEQANKSVTRGQITGSTYTSEYSGLTFNKPDSWVFSTDEQIAQTLNIGSEMLDHNAFEQTLATMSSVYDMMATDPTSGSSVIVAYENLKISNSTALTENEYCDIVEQQLVANTAMSVTPVQRQNVTLCGSSYLRADYDSNVNGVTVKQSYYMRKMGDYMSLVIISLAPGSTLEEVEAMFA